MATKPIPFDVGCVKTLTSVEAERKSSNQHEFQGVAALKIMFGEKKVKVNAIFSIRGEDEEHSAILTWYDARENNERRSPEYRLYFQSTPVMDSAKKGDTIIIGKRDNQFYCELIKDSSSGVQHSHGWKSLK
ncbi:hypothetical protein N473_18435 [Pseudoalteromonas luteoviolacea CPMOR-1]|uniref:Type II restriction endonuclease n=1 Tax=Pseudoalteromonas luteoviolacea CPMOR-1 TaxID=1365248 RepID=A0A161YMJ1_9GAMM|nr:hypothetical protein [Pseudoalteromonas luteoviolacea]KZN62894.1 hypothetical protein N473_18435 [Pseudoalteromonas luteoviolacea CPMOR-1]